VPEWWVVHAGHMVLNRSGQPVVKLASGQLKLSAGRYFVFLKVKRKVGAHNSLRVNNDTLQESGAKKRKLKGLKRPDRFTKESILINLYILLI